MIRVEELRAGNIILQKINTRIVPVTCTLEHFALFAAGNAKDFFPVLLSPEWFLKAGFIENIDYPLLPAAREFKLKIPVQTENDTELQGYMKNNKECFARVMVNKLVAGNPLYNMHQLQNVHHALTGKELEIRL
jgi:hypothetical protein